MTGARPWRPGARRRWLAALAALLPFVIGAPRAGAAVYGARVVDADTGQAIAGAIVTGAGGARATTDADGWFRIDIEGTVLRVRAAGYRRREVDAGDQGAAVALAPFAPKALYLSFYGIGDRALRDDALRLIEQTELNALVIDVKGDLARIPYESAVPLAAEVGAQRARTIPDIHRLMQELHARGVYTIARIVVFKDPLLAAARPELAVRTGGGAIWHDREGLAWVDPFRSEVWQYDIDIAVEAAANGFDEIQFDYVRFPDARGLAYAEPADTAPRRIGAITGFLAEAKRQLEPANVPLAADVFGYVCWNPDDTKIGQRLEALAQTVDIVSPMLYPSSFQFGIPGYRFAVAHPYEIVAQSLARAQRRTQLPPVRFRPWLQAFRDYGFDHRAFAAHEIRAQIDAAESFGSNGWMLWNARNTYSSAGLRPE